MTLGELRKIKSSQYVYYEGAKAYLYVLAGRSYYLFSNNPNLNGSDPFPVFRSALGFSYSYWLANEDSYDPYNRHVDIVIVKKRRRLL